MDNMKALKRQIWKDVYIPEGLRNEIEISFNEDGDPIIKKKDQTKLRRKKIKKICSKWGK